MTATRIFSASKAVLLGFSLVLVGCTGASVQPQADLITGPDGTPVPAAPAPVIAQPDPQQQEALENINNRITLLQEQILQLKVQNGGLAERSQLLLTQFQALAQTVKLANRNQPATAQQQQPGSADVNQLVARLDQQLNELEQLAPALGGGNAFRLATTYSAKRKWILVRYNRLTGESWISDGGTWQPLLDDEVLNFSEYEIQIRQAGSDAKGYVAARIDNNSGDTWWLNDKQWVLYE